MNDHGIARGAGRLKITPEAYRAHVEAGERWCSWHRSWHPLADFNPRRAATDGVQNNCRTGNRLYQRQWLKERVQ